MKKIILLLMLSTLIFAKPYPIMKVTDTNNKTLTIQGTSNGLTINELKGKVLFIEFFGHNCPPCLRSIPHLKQLQATHKNNIAVVAIEVQGFSGSELKSFAASKGINYITISQDKGEALLSYIAARASWNGFIPFLTVVDKKGTVQLLKMGEVPYESLDKIAKQLSK